MRELAFDKMAYRIQRRTDRWGTYATVLPRPPTVDRETFVEMWYVREYYLFFFVLHSLERY